MTAKPTTRVKRTGIKIAFKLVASGVVFLGLFVTIRQLTLVLGVASVPHTASVATAAFIAGVAAQRYVL